MKNFWSRDMTSQSRDDVIITGYGNLCAFNIHLIVLYDSQEAKNLHECASRYRGYCLHHFKIICPQVHPENPQKRPKNTPKLEI